MSQVSYQQIIFDCDGTLSRIEGIDRLAEYNDCGELISQMTERAMSSGDLSLDLYQNRLDLVKPSQQQLDRLAQDYIDNVTEDAQKVVGLLRKLGKQVCIASAGLMPAVKPFGHYLGVDDDYIYAVDMSFDADGGYLDFDQDSSLVKTKGKYELIRQIRGEDGIVLIGDGRNDLSAKPAVDLFVGFGGAIHRPVVEENAHHYVKDPSLLKVLPLILTAHEMSLIEHEI